MTKVGNSKSANLSHKALGTDASEPDVTTAQRDEQLAKGDDLHARSIPIGRAFAARYRRIMAALAK